ncbi:hypothetical protein DQ04_00241090 [Trypanosoma grayi]|uniref:hypothetical protein n=1 Tax=Trypanosoma grayi TaxID=71804 RepID=UPI0004F43321|nr:hypothetical protein DQ04_00241090 [Trypanosoma grayi]KEG14967.1 hypothetical protein DQ04_00241090 [Trypanosoma grayi]
MAAFAEHDELLFGEDARALYARTPDVVVPYLFAFAAVAAEERHRGQHGDTNNAGGDNGPHCEEGKPPTGMRHCLEEAARRHYKGYCPLVCNEKSESHQLCFASPRQDETDDNADGKCGFLAAEDMLVEFFNHVKKHTVDGACGLTPTAAQSPILEEAPQQEQRPKIVLTVVVPRHLFPTSLIEQGESAPEEDGKDKKKSNSTAVRRRDAVQWVKDAIISSHFGAVAEHVSVLFSDEAAVLAMDAVLCRPHSTHPMAGRYFLLPPSAVATTQAAGEEGKGISATPWPSARVLVVIWGALGVSLTRLRLEAGCVVDEPRPLFLRATQTAATAQSVESCCIATTPCGGGDAVDLALRDRLATTFAQQQRRVLGYQSLSDFPSRAQRRLLLAAEEKKVALSKAAQVPVEIEALAEGVDLRDAVTFSRVRVDAALRGEWKILEAFEKVLREFIELMQNEEEEEESGVIDAVVLSGGMLQMPCVAQSLRHLFTQCSVAPGDGRRCFAHNLVIMEAGTSTTVVGDGNSGAVETVANSNTVGAEELVSIGGCLHSYHLSLAALQEREHGRRDRAAGGKKNKTKKALSRKQQERAEGTRRVWRALTYCSNNDDNDDDGDDEETQWNEVVVLQRPILLYTHSSIEALSSAIAQQKEQEEEDAPFQIPAEALSVLFAAQTPLPARVVVPLVGEKQEPFVFYLFTEAQKRQQQQVRSGSDGEENVLRSVVPLSDTGVTLPLPEGGQDPKKWKRCIVFTLRADGNREPRSVEKKDAAVGMQLEAQLVRVAAHAPLPNVLKPTNVLESVAVDL